MSEIGRGSEASNCQSVSLSIKGSTLPGAIMKDTFNLSEWVFFPLEPEKVKQLTLTFGKYRVSLNLHPQCLPIIKTNELFQQWNSVIIQLHRSKEIVPQDALTRMERLYSTQLENLKTNTSKTIQDRIARKNLKTYETEFKSQVKDMKTILTDTLSNEQEIVEKVLRTTVSGSKYENRAYQFKGHTDKNFEEDCEEFMKIFDVNKDEIKKIQTTPEDCCRITMASTLTDIQDADFQDLFKLGKYEFLKQFTITGIPVFAPTRDSLTVNPWSYTVQTMLHSPYTIMSQVSLESFAESNNAGATHKEVKIKWDEEDTRFNAVVPVFPPNSAKVMEPFVHTRLYAMCVTFAVLKNPHIVDFNVHMAALGSTWARILYDHPSHPRPEFVRTRLESIEATAALYLNRPNYERYWNVLKTKPAQALMTESTEQVNDKTLKCETLVKPMFILHMNNRSGDSQSPSVMTDMVRMMILEYIGRCLSQYKIKDKNATRFIDFFAATPINQEQKNEWCNSYARKAKKKFLAAQPALLKQFYTLEDLKKATKIEVIEEIKQLKKDLAADIPIKVNMEKVTRLRNVSSAGDISWSTLQTFAKELGLSQDVVNELFSEKSAFIYTTHALQYRTSRRRLMAEVLDSDGTFKVVKSHIENEVYKVIAKDLSKELCQLRETAWLAAYTLAHKEVVLPLTKQDILDQAKQIGVDVMEETFDQVYRKYRSDVGLLGNACQSRSCPHYLQPKKSYNQHAFVERSANNGNFLHGLHRVAFEDRHRDLTTTISSLQTRMKHPIDANTISSIRQDLKNLQDVYKT